MARRGLFDGAAIELGQLPLGNAGPAPPEPGALDAWRRESGINIQISNYMRRSGSDQIQLTTAKRRLSGVWIDLFPAPPSGLSPDAIGTTPTFWYDGDNSPQYKGSTSSDAATANNDNMQRGDSVSGATIRCFSDAGGIRKIPVSATNDGFYYPSLASATGYSFYTRPAGTANPSVVSTVADVFTNALKTIIVAVKIDDAQPDSGISYGNAWLFGDSAAYMGLFCYKSGSNVVFQAYNWNGGEQVAAATVTNGIGQWVIVGYKHSGGQVRVYINGTQVGSAVSSGNTDVTAGTVKLGGQSLLNMAQFALWNADISDANIMEVSRYFGARVGLTL